MKKRFLVCLLACVMTLSFAFPVVAAAATILQPASTVAEHEITPFNDRTQIFFRTYRGVLQMRVWNLTRGIWITDWMDVPVMMS